MSVTCDSSFILMYIMSFHKGVSNLNLSINYLCCCMCMSCLRRHFLHQDHKIFPVFSTNMIFLHLILILCRVQCRDITLPLHEHEIDTNSLIVYIVDIDAKHCFCHNLYYIIFIM